MKFLPPAAALQLTQKSSKAVENAAAFAEAAAQGVISAQELVSGCKKALAAAEHACSDLIEEKGSTDEELLTFTHFAQYFAQRAQAKHAESAGLGERLQQQQGIVSQQTQEVDNAETAAAVAIDDRESAVKKLANAQRALEDAKGKQQHSLQVTASPSALPETKEEPSSPDGRPPLDATKLNGKHRSRSKSPYSSSSKASSRSRSRGKKRARSPERASRRSRRSPSRSRRRSPPRKRTPPRRSRSRPRRSPPHRRASSPISFRQRDSLRRDSKRSPPRRRRSPSPPSPRRRSKERRSERIRPASKEHTSSKKAAEDKGKSKWDSKDSNDHAKSDKAKPIKKAHPASKVKAESPASDSDSEDAGPKLKKELQPVKASPVSSSPEKSKSPVASDSDSDAKPRKKLAKTKAKPAASDSSGSDRVEKKLKTKAVSSSESSPSPVRRKKRSRSVSSSSVSSGARRTGRRARSRSRVRSPVRRRVSSRGRSPIPLRPGQRRPSDLRIDDNTKALFLQGLKTVLRRKRTPFNISLINDVMRAEDRRWNVRVAFDVSFAVLCQKFELDKEIVLGYSGDSVMIDSAPKYEVDRRSLSPVKRGGRSISPVRRSKVSLSPVPRRGGKSISPPSKHRSISPIKRPARSPSPVRARKRSPSPPPRRRRRSLTPRRRSLSPPGAAGDRWVMK